MKFIDLFAGLGGFHKALHELKHECVFASEINENLCELYEKNWGIKPFGDIRKIVKNNIDAIPEHDILCAGFPCQPFSKAGKQAGRDDIERGTLFDEIVSILKYRKPKYFILENVPFIRQHDNEATWNYMHAQLSNLGYEVDQHIYSPIQFGIPQHRKRIFIIGSLDGLDHFSFSEVDKLKSKTESIYNFCETHPTLFRPLPKANQQWLKLWQNFINQVPKDVKIPTFPIWAMEFGATYPYQTSFPLQLSAKELGKYKGNFGFNLRDLKKREQRQKLPSYARVLKAFPDWKRRYIEQNRTFYKENKKFIEESVNVIAEYPYQSWQKLEWNVGDGDRNISKYIIQFRASGIRVKNVDYFPSLVCTSTQIPIIGWQNRYISRYEGLKLQSLEGIELPDNGNAAFRALGNAVNSKIVKYIAEKLIVSPTEVVQDFENKKIIQWNYNSNTI